MKKSLMIAVPIIIAVLALVVFFLTKKSPSPALSTKNSTQAPERRKEDINWDDKVDYLDSNIINLSLGCKKNDACWSKVIGKTVTGDNPIYSSDLDLNGDGIVDAQDAVLVR